MGLGRVPSGRSELTPEGAAGGGGRQWTLLPQDEEVGLQNLKLKGKEVKSMFTAEHSIQIQDAHRAERHSNHFDLSAWLEAEAG